MRTESRTVGRSSYALITPHYPGLSMAGLHARHAALLNTTDLQPKVFIQTLLSIDCLRTTSRAGEEYGT